MLNDICVKTSAKGSRPELAFLTSAKAEVAQPAQVGVFQQKQKCQQQQDLQASD